MKYLCSLLLCLIPMTLHAQGVLEKMQSDISDNKLKLDSLAAELMAQKAKLATLETDMTAQKTVSQALQAELNAEKIKVATLEASILIYKNRLDAAEASIAQLAARVAALENPNPPPPPPPPPTFTTWQLKLVGGLRLEEGFCRGQFTIDHAGNRLYMQDQGNGTSVFDITGGHTVGTEFNLYRKLKPIEKIPAWWPKAPTAQGTYAGSYMMKDGKLWAVLKNFYDTNPKNETVLLARDGEKITVNGLRGQAFGGLVKPATGDPLLGSGGNDSGSGGSFGPTLGTLAGVNLVDYPFSNIAWENRAPRPANYFRLPLDAQDVWFCCNPRDTDGDGVAEGKWAADQIYGSGVIHSTGIYRWVTLGVDQINYDYQSRCLARKWKNVVYRYHPTTYQLLDITDWGVDDGAERFIAGGELSPDGNLLYVMQCNRWKSGMYNVDPVLFVYEVK